MLELKGGFEKVKEGEKIHQEKQMKVNEFESFKPDEDLYWEYALSQNFEESQVQADSSTKLLDENKRLKAALAALLKE